MKLFIVALITILGSLSFASKFSNLKTEAIRNQTVANTFSLFQRACKEQYTGCGLHQVVSATNNSDKTIDEKTILLMKEVLHRFSGADLSDGIGLAKLSGDQVKDVKIMNSFIGDSLGGMIANDQAALANSLKAALLKAATSSTLKVFVGNGAGNNTMATEAMIYDAVNKQIIFLIWSNFGSDN